MYELAFRLLDCLKGTTPDSPLSVDRLETMTGELGMHVKPALRELQDMCAADCDELQWYWHELPGWRVPS